MKNQLRASLLEAEDENMPQALVEYGDEFGELSLGDFSDFKKIFITPWTDATKSIMGSVARLSNRSRTAVEVALKGIRNMVIPGLQADYKSIFANESHRMDRIEQKYGAQFKAAKDLFKGDASLVAFLLNPVMMTTSIAAKASPNIILDLVGALAGDSRLVIKKTEDLSRAFKTIQKTSALRHAKQQFGFGDHREGRQLGPLLEGEENDAVVQMLKEPDVQRALQNSPIVRGMRRDAQLMVNTTLNDILQKSRDVSELKDLEGLQRVLGKPLTINLKALPAEEQQQVEQVVLQQAKDSVLGFFIQTLEMTKKELTSGGVPETADLIKVYDKTTHELKGMMGQERTTTAPA